ncbi:hypothetical protein M427DRAFT_53970 [Gonapodya prolifera JEL478]|uniref:C2H2-type domain-containing protein n=1 Tax=Gonapodya prolifera (strain JEL478) TaxID=1344416 RepID=A0A139ANS1_GONPJ|nr:hypothetical protein M427DRAFT_53970 [Gonapodya prolifera JEL478]|eukprot:KXS18135.1 hypothetical protein M427DRAFT_53970 [Gonapodya prolifera JEL478]
MANTLAGKVDGSEPVSRTTDGDGASNPVQPINGSLTRSPRLSGNGVRAPNVSGTLGSPRDVEMSTQLSLTRSKRSSIASNVSAMSGVSWHRMSQAMSFTQSSSRRTSISSQMVVETLSRSIHSGSFRDLNRVESDFCRDFFCCGRRIDSLHELYSHYEEAHPESKFTQGERPLPTSPTGVAFTPHSNPNATPGGPPSVSTASGSLPRKRFSSGSSGVRLPGQGFPGDISASSDRGGESGGRSLPPPGQPLPRYPQSGPPRSSFPRPPRSRPGTSSTTTSAPGTGSTDAVVSPPISDALPGKADDAMSLSSMGSLSGILHSQSTDLSSGKVEQNATPNAERSQTEETGKGDTSAEPSLPKFKIPAARIHHPRPAGSTNASPTPSPPPSSNIGVPTGLPQHPSLPPTTQGSLSSVAPPSSGRPARDVGSQQRLAPPGGAQSRSPQIGSPAASTVAPPATAARAISPSGGGSSRGHPSPTPTPSEPNRGAPNVSEENNVTSPDWNARYDRADRASDASDEPEVFSEPEEEDAGRWAGGGRAIKTSFGVPNAHGMSTAQQDRDGDKRYVCPLPGCGKVYKNRGGLKYHMAHSHPAAPFPPVPQPPPQPTITVKIPAGLLGRNGKRGRNVPDLYKPYLCAVEGCGKRYKNLNGVKYHLEHAHPDVIPPTSGRDGRPRWDCARCYNPLPIPPDLIASVSSHDGSPTPYDDVEDELSPPSSITSPTYPGRGFGPPHMNPLSPTGMLHTSHPDGMPGALGGAHFQRQQIQLLPQMHPVMDGNGAFIGSAPSPPLANGMGSPFTLVGDPNSTQAFFAAAVQARQSRERVLVQQESNRRRDRFVQHVPQQVLQPEHVVETMEVPQPEVAVVHQIAGVNMNSGGFHVVGGVSTPPSMHKSYSNGEIAHVPVPMHLQRRESNSVTQVVGYGYPPNTMQLPQHEPRGAVAYSGLIPGETVYRLGPGGNREPVGIAYFNPAGESDSYRVNGVAEQPPTFFVASSAPPLPNIVSVPVHTFPQHYSAMDPNTLPFQLQPHHGQQSMVADERIYRIATDIGGMNTMETMVGAGQNGLGPRPNSSVIYPWQASA